ncbi:MAG: hypothetical protein ACOYN0_01505 [Phycisphaerales bacterium]
MDLDDQTPVWFGPNLAGPLSAMALTGVFAEPAVLMLRAIGLPLWTAICITAATVAVAFYFVFRHWTRRAKVSEWARNPGGLISDPSYRLRLVGPGEQNLQILRDLEVDEAFEPLVRRSWGDHQFLVPIPQKPFVKLAPSDFRGAGVVLFGAVVVLTLAGITLLKYLRLTFQTTYFPMYHEVLGAFGVAQLARGWISPTFLRLSPGRLDVMHWRFMNLGRPTCRSYDLRTARITVALPARTARIEDPNNATHPILVCRWRVDKVDGLDWPTLLLRAARTKYPTPALPDDSLIG